MEEKAKRTAEQLLGDHFRTQDQLSKQPFKNPMDPGDKAAKKDEIGVARQQANLAINILRKRKRIQVQGKSGPDDVSLLQDPEVDPDTYA